MGLYERWCNSTKQSKGRRHYCIFVEKENGRDAIRTDLATVIRSHYERLDRIDQDLKRLDFEAVARIVRAQQPQTPTLRSGELGEILATELVEEEVGLSVPVRRLRYKDSRDMAMRGDDFIGAKVDGVSGDLALLKGESKSRQVLDRATVEGARGALTRDQGRCSPGSLLFVTNILMDSGDPASNELGRRIRDEVGTRSLSPDQISHMLFTVSGNGPHASLEEDFESIGTDRTHYVVNLHIEDHQDFIQAAFEAAGTLGDS